MSTKKQTAQPLQLNAYGVPAGRVSGLLGEVSADSLNFLDLFKLPVATDQPGAAIRPDAVVAGDSGAVLYVIDEQRLFNQREFDEPRLAELCQKLASRGSHGYLARLRPGEIVVTPISLDQKKLEPIHIRADSPDAAGFYTALSSGQLPAAGTKRNSSDFVFDAMFRLVWSVADRLAKLKIKQADVLSLVGRALFFRFLKDRSIVRKSHLAKILPDASDLIEAFDTPANAAATCRWLDDTFNGDLLPLSDISEDFFTKLGRRTGNRLFAHLHAIVEGTEPVGDDGYQLPLRLDFGDFDFAHVPVGLLSQVYERFAWKWEHKTAKSTSVHYTPRHIAQLMVNDAFDGLPKADQARVLDPACGASVFLVLAFRRLYQERWKASGKRPQTKEIRDILEHQLVGFDINESAIRLASLSLYLTAIELDPDPSPPEKLHFKPLRDRVLHNFRQPDEEGATGAIAGSMGDEVPATFNSDFDLVIGNPPWTSLKKKETALANALNDLSKRIIRARGSEELAKTYTNPDRTPDLPFVWRSTQWCKPEGRIVLALPASILLKKEAIPARARETLFRLIEVNGIINGTNLSDTRVWENMNQPFIALFATNRLPSEDHQLRMITPYLDEKLNRRGLFRIDSKSTQWIDLTTTFTRPWMWKALSLGTSLDVEVTNKILEQDLPTVSEYWEEQLGLVSGQGYQVAEKQTQLDATFLIGKPDLTKVEPGRFQVYEEILPRFNRQKLAWPRKKEIYQAPLFLLKEFSPAEREDAFSLIAFEDIAYNRGLYGYSAYSHPNGADLVRYLLLFSHSALWIHHRLVTSSILGAERRIVYKSTFDDFPIVPFERLNAKQRKAVKRLSDRLLKADTSVFSEIDTLFAEVYGLDELDLAVIRDTIETAMPFQAARNRACNPPDKGDVLTFTDTLQAALQPFFAVADELLEVHAIHEASKISLYELPFQFILLQRRGTDSALPPEALRKAILHLAEQGGVTRIIQHLPDAVLVGLYNQYRYWTPSRTRLLAAEIAREHLTAFDD